MKKTLLLFLLLLTPFAHAFHPDNILELQKVERWGGSQPYNDTRPIIVIFSLRNAPTQLYTTGIITREDWSNQYEARNYVGTPFTVNNIVEYLKFTRGTHEYSNLSQSSWSGNFESKDYNGNAIPDFREYIAGGEPLYWTSCGNGWQFYVNGAMKVCNSDTNWETVPYTQVPPSVATEYPDENRNGIPDIVDAAIAAGGGATSQGGNITVTVENKEITVNVDNTEVLAALQTIKDKLNNVNVDNTEVLTAIQTLSTKIDGLQGTGGGEGSGGSGGHCDALQLKPYIATVSDTLDVIKDNQSVQIADSRQIKQQLALLLSVFYDGIDWRSAHLPDWIDPEDKPVLRNGLGGLGGAGGDQPIKVEVVNNPLNVEVVGQLPLDVAEIKQYLLTDQKANLDRIVELLEGMAMHGSAPDAEVSKDEIQGDSFENAVSDSDAARRALESDLSSDKWEVEDQHQFYHSPNDKRSLSVHFAKRFFRLFNVDYDKFSKEDQGKHFYELKYDTGYLSRLAGHADCSHAISIKIPLDDERLYQGYEPYSLGFQETVSPIKQWCRLLLMFILFWAFAKAILDVVHSAWSY